MATRRGGAGSDGSAEAESFQSDPYGGFGRIAGLGVALVILQTIYTAFNLLGLSAHLTLSLWGLTLLAVMGAKRAMGTWTCRAL